MEYKIGSFNLRRFGKYSNKDLDIIAKIINDEQLDVVALQEIFSNGEGLKRLLDTFVKFQIYGWDFCCANPGESSDFSKMHDMLNNDTRGECYAYLWNKRKFKLAEFERLGEKRVFEPRIINSLSRDVYKDCSIFARTPYYIRLEPLYGGFFELRLIDIHIYFGKNDLSSIQKRQFEFQTLVQDIYPQISTKRYGNFRVPYTIALGDYNLNIIRPYRQVNSCGANLTEVYTYNDGKINVLTIQDQLSTLRDPTNENNSVENISNYANNYDHFTYSPELSGFRNVSCKVIEAVHKYCRGDYNYYWKNISDHLPIVMSISI